jgi:uncharacterized protein
MRRAVFLLMMHLLIVGCGGTEQDASQTGHQNEPQASGGKTPGREPTVATSGESTSAGGTNTSELSTVTIYAASGENVKVWVEIVDDPLGRYMGLRGRESLPENQGMLFVYPSEQQELTFTMADTLIPLSIAFIDSERRIIDIQDMKPLDGEPPGYEAGGPAQYALEVNKGYFDERGVEVGDTARLPV